MKKTVLMMAFAAFAGLGFAQKAAPAKKTIADYFYSLHGDDENFKKEINDVKNGYIKYEELGMEGWQEMVLWRWGKQDLICRTVASCGPACSMGFVHFYFGGSTNPVNDKVLPTKEIQKMFEDIEAKLEQDSETAGISQKDGKVFVTDYTRWYKLPQKGRTLQVGFLVNQISDTEKFIPVLDLEPKGDKFVIVKNHGISNFK